MSNDHDNSSTLIELKVFLSSSHVLLSFNPSVFLSVWLLTSFYFSYASQQIQISCLQLNKNLLMQMMSINLFFLSSSIHLFHTPKNFIPIIFYFYFLYLNFYAQNTLIFCFFFYWHHEIEFSIFFYFILFTIISNIPTYIFVFDSWNENKTWNHFATGKIFFFSSIPSSFFWMRPQKWTRPTRSKLVLKLKNERNFWSWL